MAVDCISYADAYSGGKSAEHEGLPPEINILLSLGIGITATKVAGKYLLKDAKGAVLGEIHDHPAGGEGKSNFAKNIDAILAKQGITLDEFNSLRLRDVTTLNKNEKATLKAIRESIPMPDSNTEMQKAIPSSDIEKYLNGTYTQVGGYVARAADVAQLKTYDDIFDSLCLGYPGSEFKPIRDDSIGVIRFTTGESSRLSIPYGKEMGGTEVAQQPFTGNGFTKAINGQIIPEFKSNGYLDVADGAQLVEIHKNGTETVRAVYSKIDKKFIPIN